MDDYPAFLEALESTEIPMEEIMEIAIITTSQGPIYPDIFWLLKSESNYYIIPSEGPGENFLEEVQHLPGFDNETIIKAMQSTEDDIFKCYNKK